VLRLLVVLHLLVFSLFACKGDNYSCIQKIIDSSTLVNQTLQIPTAKHQRLVFSEKIPHAVILKSDPFLGLYLVKDAKGFNYPFLFNKRHISDIFYVNNHTSRKGRIVQKQVGLNRLAAFSTPFFSPGLLTDSCCFLEGIATPRGVIEREYIQRFLSNKESRYSDIGIRVKMQMGLVSVIAADPFVKENPFLKGDCILELDGKKVTGDSLFMKNILFSKIGSLHTLQVKRNSQVLTFKVYTQALYGGGYVSDTFLEKRGIYFTSNLVINEINNKTLGLKTGDKLLQVNGEKVQNQQEVMVNISNFKKSSSLLFERDGFQFFVNVN